jgi:hypothetical protein
MALTSKGQIALAYIKKYFPKGQFSAKDLSDACGEKIVAAVLTGVANNGYIVKYPGTPVMFEAIDELEELLIAEQAEKEASKCTNTNLRKAAKTKNDEFYTQYEDIEEEVMLYRRHFRNKIVYLPCDDPAEKKSEFWSFFVNNFDSFGLKKLIATHYDENGKAYKIWIDEDTTGDGYIDDADALQEDLEGNGDFRSEECIEILKECDIVCTNPPFSLFREFISLINEYEKSFLVIGNKNAFSYKEIFTLIKNNQIWVGDNSPKNFRLEDGTVTSQVNGLCRWFTNLPSKKRNEELILTKSYSEIEYPYLDNYNAINIDRVVNIPKDFDGYMAAPITFIDKYNPDQFEIFGITNTGEENPGIRHPNTPHGRPLLNGKELYIRVLIKRK